VARALEAAGSEALLVAADVTRAGDADRAVAETVARFGRLDIIINAVGGGAGTALHPAEAYPGPNGTASSTSTSGARSSRPRRRPGR